MDYTLQIHGEKRVYPVPNGLYELLSDIVREVLRAQPKAIVPFISDYLQALVTTRELSKEAVEIVDSVLTAGEENIRLCLKLGISLDEANRASATIQAAWRGYVVRKRFRKKKDYKEKRTPHFVDLEQQARERKLAEDLDQFLERKKITFLEALTAARIIQAAWKSYKERVLMRRGPSDESVLGWAHPWLKEFDKKSIQKDEKPFPKAKLFPQRTSSLLYLPRRPITADPQRLKALFHGQREDYESLERSLSKLMDIEGERSETDQKEPSQAPIESLSPYAFIPSLKEGTTDGERPVIPETEELYQKIYGTSEDGGRSELERRLDSLWVPDETVEVVPSSVKIKTAWADEEEEEEQEDEIAREDIIEYEQEVKEEEEDQYELFFEPPPDPTAEKTHGIESEQGSQPEIAASEAEFEEGEEEMDEMALDDIRIVAKEGDAALTADRELKAEVTANNYELGAIAPDAHLKEAVAPHPDTDVEDELASTDDAFTAEYSEYEDTTEAETDAPTE